MSKKQMPILIDTNIMVHHLKSEIEQVKELIDAGLAVTHPFVLAELALGSLSDREMTMAALEIMPLLPVADYHEVRDLIEVPKLYTRGIGFVDAHLIASLLIVGIPVDLWTDDVSLAAVAKDFGFLATPPFNL